MPPLPSRNPAVSSVVDWGDGGGRALSQEELLELASAAWDGDRGSSSCSARMIAQTCVWFLHFKLETLTVANCSFIAGTHGEGGGWGCGRSRGGPTAGGRMRDEAETNGRHGEYDVRPARTGARTSSSPARQLRTGAGIHHRVGDGILFLSRGTAAPQPGGRRQRKRRKER